MKDANYFAEIACREMTQDEQVKFRPLIYNLFLQAQAEAFNHAAGIADECALQTSIGVHFRQQAFATWPGAAYLDPTRKPMMEVPKIEDFEKQIKSDQGFFDPDPPSKAA